jgi:hypothetical protein
LTLNVTDTRYWYYGVYQNLAEDSDANLIIDNCFGRVKQNLDGVEGKMLAYTDNAEQLVAALMG